MPLIFKLAGVLGLVIITRGIFVKQETKRDYTFAIGGILLLIYSSYLRDLIFIILQLVFIASNFYEIKKLKFSARHLPLSISNEETIKLVTGKTDE